MGLAEIVQEQIKALPEGEVKEVLDFIGYLKTRQEQSLARCGINPDDEVWNHV